MLKRLSLYTLLLCLVPFFVWIFKWQWQGDSALTHFDYFLYWLTETGSSPYALITCGVFALLFLAVIPTRKQWMLAVGIMAFSTVLTQGVKSGLKTVFAEPRPYIEKMAEKSEIPPESFYGQTRKQRGLMVSKFYAGRAETPDWLVHHRENETGYSFPSGHTIFGASWLLLAVGFTQIFGYRTLKARLLVGGIALWALLMLISRLRLGMHNPIDLLTSTLIAWIMHCGLFIFLQRKAIFPKNES
ncbi:MAG TPA: hypothetical protein DD638_03280 [Pasteurellaceae bacterium]|nr:hypothetical protein [Pasteurellaceae bacterium]